MSVTVSGVIAREGDVAATYFRSGALASAESFERMAEQLPSDGVAVTVGHGGERVGELIFGEVDAAGQVNGVCVLDDDTILRIDSPVFLSAELVTVGRGMTRARATADVAGLVGLALVGATATHGAPPVRVREGDLRDARDRTTWPLSWATADPLLRRALDALDGRPRITRLERRAETPPMRGGWTDFDGRPCAGPTHHAAGRVIAVR